MAIRYRRPRAWRRRRNATSGAVSRERFPSMVLRIASLLAHEAPGSARALVGAMVAGGEFKCPHVIDEVLHCEEVGSNGPGVFIV